MVFLVTFVANIIQLLKLGPSLFLFSFLFLFFALLLLIYYKSPSKISYVWCLYLKSPSKVSYVWCLLRLGDKDEGVEPRTDSAAPREESPNEAEVCVQSVSPFFLFASMSASLDRYFSSVLVLRTSAFPLYHPTSQFFYDFC